MIYLKRFNENIEDDLYKEVFENEYEKNLNKRIKVSSIELDEIKLHLRTLGFRIENASKDYWRIINYNDGGVYGLFFKVFDDYFYIDIDEGKDIYFKCDDVIGLNLVLTKYLTIYLSESLEYNNKELSADEFERDTKRYTEDFTKQEKELLLDLFHNNGICHYHEFSIGENRRKYKGHYEFEYGYKLELWDNKYIYEAQKLDDDWIFVKIKNISLLVPPIKLYYKCDTIDGFIDLLKEREVIK